MSNQITFDKFIRWSGVILITLTVLYLVNYLAGVLLPFVVAWLFAYLLYPIVQFVQYRMRVKIRAVAIIITLILAIAVIGGIVYLIIPPMLEQFQKLGEILTRWVYHTTHTNDLSATISQWLDENRTEIERFFRSDDFSKAVKAAMPKLFSFVGHTASIIMSIVASMITLLYMFFILLDYEYLTANWIRIFPKKNRPFWPELMKDVERELKNVWLVFGLAVGLFIVVQIITAMVVTPKIMGKAMGLNPAILLLSLSVWGALLGFIGLIIALPLTTLLIAYWGRYVTKENAPNTVEDKEKTEKSEE